MQNKEPEIIYEDSRLMVCDKPAGFPAETAWAGRMDLVSWVRNYRAGRGEEPYAAVITRLDQPVEGLMVLALDRKAAADMSSTLQKKLWKKEYYAVVCRIPEKKKDRLIHWIRRDARANRSVAYPQKVNGGKRASLSYQVLQEDTGRQLALLKVHLETGRHHQIRAQLSAIGHPLYGDRKYGAPDCGGYCPLALCAESLSFPHPDDGRRMHFQIRPKGEGFWAFADSL